jgi:zinc protease
MKTPIRLLALIFASLALVHSIADAQSTTVKVGGETIAIPLPDAKFVEMGAGNHPKWEKDMQKQNRLLAGFVQKTDLDAFTAGTNPPLRKFFQLAAVRACETQKLGDADFATIPATFKIQLAGRSYDTVQAELKALTPPKIKGHAFAVGTLFESANAYAFCNIFSFGIGDKEYYYASGTVFFRVKGKLMTALCNISYNGSQTVAEVKSNLEAWVKAIEEANDPSKSVGRAVFWAQDESDIPADPSITWGRLSNGLRYAIMKNAEPPRRVSMRLCVNAGSAFESDSERGYAHFVEHMTFNGTKHHPGNEIVEYLQHLGMSFGGDTNAFTFFDRTVFMLELPGAEAGTMGDAMLTLRDFADGISFDEKAVQDEKGVILAEKAAGDSVQLRMMKDNLNFLSPECVLPTRLPIGEDITVKSATPEKLRAFYNKWYTPDRMTVIVCGDVNSADVEKLVAKYFGDMPAKPAQKTPDLGKIAPRGTISHVFRDAEAPNVQVSIFNLRQSPHTPDTVAKRNADLAKEAAFRIVTRRFDMMAKKSDSPFTAACGIQTDYLVPDFAKEYGMYAVCSADKWEASLAAIEKELRSALRYGFTKEELAEAAANMKNDRDKAAKQAATRKSADLANAIANAAFSRCVFSTPEEDLKIASAAIDSLTPESVLEAFRDAWKDDTRLVYAGGKLAESVDDKVALAAYGESAKVAVTPPVKTETSAFAYTDFGPAGQIVERKTIAESGITQIKFANNVFVNIKPTDFEKDVVHIHIQLGTGIIGVPKDKTGLQFLAMLNFVKGGLEKHSADDISRIFAGRNVGAVFMLKPDAFVLGGQTAPRDLQDELDLMAAYVAHPGYRDDGMSQTRMALQQVYGSMRHTLAGVFGSNGMTLFTCGDYRFELPDLDATLTLTMGDLKEWLDPQLKNSRIEISIDGDIAADEVIPMLAKTFGALPPRETEKNVTEEMREIKIAAPQTKTFEYESENPQATVVLLFPTDDMWNNPLAVRLNVISAIAADRLRVELREKLGDVYTPAAQNIPSDGYTHFGYFFCEGDVAPDKVDETSAILRKVVADIAANGVTVDEFTRAVKPMLERIPMQMRDNNYWTGGVLCNCLSHPEVLDWARNAESDLKAVTAEEINAIAKEYLDPSKAIEIRIVPVKKGAPVK